MCLYLFRFMRKGFGCWINGSHQEYGPVYQLENVCKYGNDHAVSNDDFGNCSFVFFEILQDAMFGAVYQFVL